MDAHGEYLAFLDSEETEQTPERFSVDSDSRANWALRKLSSLEARKAERQRFVDAEMARLQTWQAQEDQKAQRFMDYLTALLRTYYDALKATGVVTEKAKSYKLPHGVLSERTAPIEYERDDAKLLEWASPLGFVRTKEAPAWDMIKMMITPEADQAFAGVLEKATGKPVPGIRVKQPSREVFTVSANPD